MPSDLSPGVLDVLKCPKAGGVAPQEARNTIFSFRGSSNSELRELLWVVYFYIDLACKLPWRKLAFICIFIFKEVVLF